MKAIRFTRHALEQGAERGAAEAEVCEAIQSATWEPAKNGRFICRYNFQFNQEWQGNFYAIKKVAPVFVESDTEIVVITVYTFYF